MAGPAGSSPQKHLNTSCILMTPCILTTPCPNTRLSVFLPPPVRDVQNAVVQLVSRHLDHVSCRLETCVLILLACCVLRLSCLFCRTQGSSSVNNNTFPGSAMGQADVSGASLWSLSSKHIGCCAGQDGQQWGTLMQAALCPCLQAAKSLVTYRNSMQAYEITHVVPDRHKSLSDVKTRVTVDECSTSVAWHKITHVVPDRHASLLSRQEASHCGRVTHALGVRVCAGPDDVR